MEVRIRMQRAGNPAQKTVNWRIVAANRPEARQGGHLDILGYYDPGKKNAPFKIDYVKLEKWLKNGAQMTDTIRTLVNKDKREAAKKK